MSVVSADPPHTGEAPVGSLPSPASPSPASHQLPTTLPDKNRAFAVGPPPSASQLAENRIRLLKQTWALVERDVDDLLTVRFYNRLFAKHPDTRQLFGEGMSLELRARKLQEVLRVAVKVLDHPRRFDDDFLLASLREMGKRHARVYGVRRQHYTAVAEVFIEVLNERLDEALRPVVGNSFVLWRLDAAAAWGWLLTWIGTAMADAGDDAGTTETTDEERSSGGHSPPNGQ